MKYIFHNKIIELIFNNEEVSFRPNITFSSIKYIC